MNFKLSLAYLVPYELFVYVQQIPKTNMYVVLIETII